MAADGQAPDPPAPILPQAGRDHQHQPRPRGEALSAGNRVGLRRQFRNPEPTGRFELPTYGLQNPRTRHKWCSLVRTRIQPFGLRAAL
jgi:hypothetical protein